VDEEEVHVIEAEALQARVERGEGGVVSLVGVPDLGGDEQLVAGDAGLRDRRADLLLVVVEPGRVDVPVAGLERAGHGGVGLAGRDEEHAEAQLGDGHAVVQGHVRNGHALCNDLWTTSLPDLAEMCSVGRPA
jgi:hypothetical protein